MNEPVITSFDIDDNTEGPVPGIRSRAETAGSDADMSASVPEIRVGSYIIPGAAFTFVILLVIGFAAVKLTDPEVLPIRNVSVAGDFTHLSPARLQERVSDVVRGGFFSVNVERIQQILLEEPWIRDVSVKRVWPDRLTVTIREQTAVAQWGDEGLLNEEATIFYPDRSSFPAGLPVMIGPENSSRHVLGNLERIRAILPQGMSVRQLTLNERRSWELQLDAGPVIRLGKTGIVSRLRQLLEYLPAEGLGVMANIEYIDMRYTNGFALLKKTETRIGLEAKQDKYGKEI